MRTLWVAFFAALCAAASVSPLPRRVGASPEARDGAAPAPRLPVPPAAPTVCYTAAVASWTWCRGYAAVGYTCAGAYCSAAACLADCAECSNAYPGAVLHAASGRCCDRLDAAGGCVGPKPGRAPATPDYGLPDRLPGLLVYAPQPYPRGPPVWATAPGGAYALTLQAPPGATDAACPPPATNGSWAPGRGLTPVSLRAHGGAAARCALGCDWAAVAAGAPDPCAAGSVAHPPAAYACYWLGAGVLEPPSLGLCGFNCSVRQDSGRLCSREDVDAGLCGVYCDARRMPVWDDSDQGVL
jgi:hypothetical protein